MFYAQALLFHRAGADGLQLGFSSDQWITKSWLNELAEPENVEYADKQYMVDPVQLPPGTFKLTKDGTNYIGQRTVVLRIGDNIPEARKKGFDLASTLVVYIRALYAGEKLEIYVNGNGPVIVSGDSDEEKERRNILAIDPRTHDHSTFIFEKDQWKHGMHEISVDVNCWRLKENEIKIRYSITANEISNPLSISWIDLLFDYNEK